MRLKCIRSSIRWVDAAMKETRECDVHEETHIASVRRGSSGELWIYLEPGVTGCESASAKDMLSDKLMNGWCACAGTPNSWDKLMVPPEELERLKDVLRLVCCPLGGESKL